MQHTSLEISIQGIKILSEQKKICSQFSKKKRHLGPQNGFESSGPEKILKIVSCEKN